MRVVFTFFATESNYDFVRIYDGDTNTLLDIFSGSLGAFRTNSYAADSLLIEFTTDDSVLSTGFDVSGYEWE
jgi:hypothetical protein